MQLIHGGLAFGVSSTRRTASRVDRTCVRGSRGRAMAAAATLAGAIGAAGAGLVAGDARADGTVCVGDTTTLANATSPQILEA